MRFADNYRRKVADCDIQCSLFSTRYCLLTNDHLINHFLQLSTDSYYLMDFSNSMKDDLESLRDLAGNLTNEFAKVSENYRIGENSLPLSEFLVETFESLIT